jgi:hypothetical protein
VIADVFGRSAPGEKNWSGDVISGCEEQPGERYVKVLT